MKKPAKYKVTMAAGRIAIVLIAGTSPIARAETTANVDWLRAFDKPGLFIEASGQERARTCTRQLVTQDELNAMTWQALGSRAGPVRDALLSNNPRLHALGVQEIDEVRRRVVASLPETCRWHE